MIKNAVVGQSGGPTAAINATLSGVIRGCREAASKGEIHTLFGMRNGIEGFLKEDLVDLFEVVRGEEDCRALEATPAAALGSCRKKLKSYKDDPAFYEQMLAIFKKYDIHYFFYIGGNDSMDTVLKLSEFSQNVDYDLKVVGVPKTIDNDLCGTDHTPGFGSAAKYVATTVKEILRDTAVYRIPAVTIVEIMGRDAGWLTASAALPALCGDAPDLIYLPEVAFDSEKFLCDVRAALERHPNVVVAVSEGIRDKDGTYVSAIGGAGLDAFGHQMLSGTGKALEMLVREKIGCKVRSIELNLPQRCAAHLASLTDISESVKIGMTAVRAAVAGQSAVMVCVKRVSDEPYSVDIKTESIRGIANEVRTVPRDYVNEEGNGITEAGLRYLAPLIEGEVPCMFEHGMPKHFII